MAYYEGVAERLREVYDVHHDIVEKKMFGGLAFLVNGHMSCGVVGDSLMVRVGLEQYEPSLKRPYARPMDFTGKPLRGFVFVDPLGFESDEDLSGWVSASLEFVLSLPPK